MSEEFTPTDATATLVNSMKEAAEIHLGIEIAEAVVTCRANFRDDAKQALIEAFERSGVKVHLIMPEPTAAGYAYALHKRDEKALIVVYDFGGGTFDVSVIEVDGSQISVRATEGIPRLGGNDLNRCLKEHVLRELETVCGDRPTPESDPLLFLDLNHRIEAAKISLGNQKEVPIVVSYNGRQNVIKVTQHEFQAAITPLVQQSLEAVDGAVSAAGVAMQEIDRLLMVGGTSRLPFIQKQVTDHTGLVPRVDIDPEKAIAYGAALASVAELAKQGKTASFRGQVIPSPDLFVRDVTAHDVGCCVVDTSGSRKRLVNAVIIPKNTPVPCQRTDQFYLEHEDQTEACIEILQGEADADRDDCLLIGELLLDGLPKESKRSERIQVEYLIDANSMVTATAIDRVSSKRQTVSVEYKKGITAKKKPAAA